MANNHPSNEILVIIPTHGHFDYACATVESLLRSDPFARALVVDDASPDWSQAVHEKLLSLGHRVCVHRFTEHGGLTRSWNYGLREARDKGFRYAVCGNSDLIFTRGWEDALIEACDHYGYILAGPVSNAPGWTCPSVQKVQAYVPEFIVGDGQAYLDGVAARLAVEQRNVVIPSKINGFFLFGRTSSWWSHSFDADNVFNPDARFRMTGSEDEFQWRVWKGGGATAVVPASFIFHYRSVSRGERHRTAGSFRP